MSVQSHVFQNGAYTPHNWSISDIIAQNRDTDATNADYTVQRQRKTSPGVGLLSKTLIRSPMTKWILPAKIRTSGTNLDDLIFIGENTVYMKEILPDGFLRDLGGRAGFSAAIRSAAVLGKQSLPRPAVKVEENMRAQDRGRKSSLNTDLPQQILVLALDNHELRFMFLDPAHPHSSSGLLRFHETSIQLPAYRSPIHDPGKHLVVDPTSRAIAVGAGADTVMLYGLKDWDTLNEEYRKTGLWNPVLHERILSTKGPILAMDFINPECGEAAEGGPSLADHERTQCVGQKVALVIVVAIGTSDKMGCYEWDVEEGPRSLRVIVEAQTLRSIPKVSTNMDEKYTHCNFIIPMRHSSAFLSVHGSGVKLWRDILTGNAREFSLVVKGYDLDPMYPASSHRWPVYTSWKTVRNRSSKWSENKDEAVHLVREDGKINYVHRNTQKDEKDGDPCTNRMDAGKFDCNVGSAFTNYFTTLDQPDYLIAAGCMSSGQVLSIGTDPSKIESTRQAAMDPQNRERFPDWSAIMDLCVAQPPNIPGSRSGIFVVSGRQPHGAIHELRIGCEAKVYLEVDVGVADEMAGAYKIWALPGHEHETYLFITYPGATRTWRVTADDDIEAVDIGAEGDSATLLAAVTSNHLLLQVTEHSVLLRSYPPSFGDSVEPTVKVMPPDTTIIATAFDNESATLVYAIRASDHTEIRALSLGQSVIDIGEPLSCPGLTCLCLFNHNGQVFVIASCIVEGARGSLILFSLDSAKGIEAIISHEIDSHTFASQRPPVGESILVLQDAETEDGKCIVICGMRDGTLYTSELVLAEGNDVLLWGHDATSSLGGSPIILSQTEQQYSPCIPSEAFAICGQDFCHLSYIGSGSGSITGQGYLRISSIYHTDTNNPALLCPFIAATSPISSPSLNLPAFVSTDGKILRFATFDSHPRVIPRSIPLTRSSVNSEFRWERSAGSPTKLLWSERLSCWIVASIRCEVRNAVHPPLTTWRGRRATQGMLQFIPQASNSELDAIVKDMDTVIVLNPGERIRSVIEWTYRAGGSSYYNILVGTSQSHSDNKKPSGRLIFYSPKVNDDASINVELKINKLLDAPIWSMAVYDEKSVAICKGEFLEVWGFAPRDDGKYRWALLAKAQLLSRGIRVTVSATVIHVTLAKHSIYAYELIETRTPIDNAPSAHESSYELEPFFSDSLARMGLAHLPIRVPGIVLHASHSLDKEQSNGNAILSSSIAFQGQDAMRGRPNIVLVSDRFGSVAGIVHPEKRANKTAADTLFELSTEQCITHFAQLSPGRQGVSGVPWRRVNTSHNYENGVLVDDIVGTCTDGTVYQFLIVNNATRILLKFLENLVKWSEAARTAQQLRLELSHPGRALGDASDDEDDECTDSDEVDIEEDRIIIDPEHWMSGPEPTRKHRYAINGDTLERFLERDGAETLRMLLVGNDFVDAKNGISQRRGKTKEQSGPNSRGERIRRFIECVYAAVGDAEATPTGNLEKDRLDAAVGVCVRLLRDIMGGLL